MAFEIHLPQHRIEASRGLWLDRLPIDYLDDKVRARSPTARHSSAGTATQSAARSVSPTRSSVSGSIDRGRAYRARGRRGDVVAFQLPNWWEFTALFFACNRIGAVANPLMPIFRQRELRFMLGFAGAKIAVVPASWRGFDHMAMMREIRPDLPQLRHVFAVGSAARAPSRGPSSIVRPSPVPNSSGSRDCGRAQRRGRADLHLGHVRRAQGRHAHGQHGAGARQSASSDDIPVTSTDIIFMGSPYAHQTGFLYGMLMPSCSAPRPSRSMRGRPAEPRP